MTRQQVADWLYITRSRAIAEGFTHTGAHFGVPVWVQYSEKMGEMGMVAAKCGWMEPVIDVALAIFHFANSFRAPGEELPFPFLIQPIREGKR